MAAVHLHVLHHGMWGNSSHLSETARHIRERFPKQADSEDPEVEILLCQSNQEEGTYDGIDWGAERAVEEIDEKIQSIVDSGRKVTRFSITGYSLGGLVSRYIVGILYQRGFFKSVTPVNFSTIATPHLGLLRYPTVVSKVLSNLGAKLLGRTGRQFYAVDQYADTGKPLVEVMADKNRLFYKGLASFARIAIYANGINDRTVPFITAAFEPFDPFVTYDGNNLDLEYDEEYKPLLKSWSVKDQADIVPQPKPKMSFSAWLSSKKPAPIPGPFREWRFPMHFIWVALLPVIIPMVLVLVPTKFALSTRSSDARVKLLEGDDESMTRRLVTLWAQVEKGMEDAVEDVVEETILPAASHLTTTGDAADSTSTLAEDPVYTSSSGSTGKLPSTQRPAVVVEPKSQPLLTPAQHRMIANLNSLPNVTKHVAFFYPVRNAHGMVVCRSVTAYTEHRKGEGVLRSLADGMIL